MYVPQFTHSHSPVERIIGYSQFLRKKLISTRFWGNICLHVSELNAKSSFAQLYGKQAVLYGHLYKLLEVDRAEWAELCVG